MTRPFDQYRDSALWAAVEAIVDELIATREIAVNTSPEYVIGYVCQELTAKTMVSPGAPRPRP
jgi:hypothetical protein